MFPVRLLLALASLACAAALAQNTPEKAPVPDAARAAAARIAQENKIDPGDLVLGRSEYQPPKNPGTGGTSYVAYQQTYRGLPVFGSSLRIVVSGGKVVSTRTQLFPGIDRSVTPTLTLESVLRENAAPGTTPVSVQLGIAPRTEGKRVVHHLAWQILMPITREPDRKGRIVPMQWRYLVDADNRAVLERVDVGFTADVTGNVTGTIRANVPADPPTTVPIENVQVRVTQGAVETIADTASSGAYSVTGLATGTGDLRARLRSSRFVVSNHEAPPGAAHNAPGISVPGAHSWDWSANDASPNQVETNAFYHVNRVRDWFLRGTPFDVEGIPLLPPPSIFTVEVRSGASCQSGAFSSLLYFGSGIPGMCLDHALCSDIIYHEYTHAIVAAVYAGSGVDLRSVPHGASMHEAFADFFATSITGNPNEAGGCGAGRNIDTPDRRFPGDFDPYDEHESGRILSGSLWDLRAVLPPDYVESLAIRAMKRHPGSFQDYLGAILEEDDNPAFSTDPLANNDPTDGTPNIDAICHAFTDVHGIYHPYCGGHTSTLIALLTSPPSSGFLLVGATAPTLTVEGTAQAGSTSPLTQFTIEYAAESPTVTWVTAGVTLTGGGTSSVAGGPLGTIALAGLADGMYRVRLTVTDAAGTSIVVKGTFYVDRTIKPGWPQAQRSHFYGTPAVGDIDRAYPGQEIVAAGFPEGLLYAWHADGTTVPGWPRGVGLTQSSAPSIGDLDGDGTLEVVMPTTAGNVYVFRGDGTLFPGWPQAAGGGIFGTVALADLDGDGTLEVIVASLTQVMAWHADGTVVAGFPVVPPVTSTLRMEGSAAVGDLDNDGRPEIVVGTRDGRVFAWKGDGTPAPGWPQAIPGATDANPGVAIGDLDGDGIAEVVAIGNSISPTLSIGSVMAWHGNGTPVTGWPRPLSATVDGLGSVSLADLDGMGQLEVVVLSNDDIVQVFRANGTPVPGWPATGSLGTEFFPSSPSIADLDGDGTMEVIAEVGGVPFDGVTPNKVYAFRAGGAVMPGWPKNMAGAPGTSPVIADLDGTGHTNVIVGSDGMFVWTLPGTYDRRGAEWPTYRHDNRRTGTYLPRAGVALLFDVSSSMDWGPGTTTLAPVSEQRITLAKNAAMPFLEELNNFNLGKARFGIATFPAPSTATSYCGSRVVTPMKVINDPTKNLAVMTTIPGLTTDNSTSMLDGIRTAARMLEGHRSPALVLLTDGYHNCPGFATLGDPEVTALIARLNEHSIRLFSIGFGRASDPDYVLLQGLADRTTPAGSGVSQFFDVTTPAFDPATWTPATALQGTYKTILVDALGLQAAMDPLAIIASGTRRAHMVHLNEHDRRVSFFLSWKEPQSGRLTLTVRASDGSVVSPLLATVRQNLGETYAIITLDESFLRLPGKVGTAPWALQVDAPGVPSGESEPYQYSVITDSPLRFEVNLGAIQWIAGRKLLLTARLMEEARPVKSRSDIRVSITRPSESLDRWLARYTVTPEELRRVPVKIGNETLSPAQRKALYLERFRKLKPPAPKFGETIRLYDDGTHGDLKAGDGVYSAEIAATQTGVYSLHFHAVSKTAKGLRFERDRVMQKYVGEAAKPR